MKGEAIIKTVLQERGVSAEDFFGPGRLALLTEARIDAAVRLKASGLSPSAIARLMKRNHGTVSYWLRPDCREQRRDYYSRYWCARRGDPLKRKTTPEQREHLLALHRAGEWDAVRSMQQSLGLSRNYAASLASKRTSRMRHRRKFLLMLRAGRWLREV
jgi:hypothetical protein